MTFREWKSSCRQYLMGIGKARRDLIKSNILDTDPFWSRLWHAHLFWIARGSLFQLRSTISFVWHSFLVRYCRTADCLLGGTRYARYQENQGRDAEHSRQKIEALQKQRAESRWRDEQIISGLNQREKETERELVAFLIEGKPIIKDPKTYN